MAEIDIVVYCGSVSVAGYLELTSKIEANRSNSAKKVFFIPVTTGGDPNAGYRIARALGHYYPSGVIVGIPSVCKSAGTLMCIGGSELVIGDRGELGPLDIQLSSKDELFGYSSGLDIMQALSALQETMNAAFKNYLYDLKFGGRLGTKLASDIASNMAVGLVTPIAQQIDPVKLGEHQRAMQIAVAYGERLNSKFNNTDRARIERLLISYPAHGFVIDRKEIAELFNEVRCPNDVENKVFDLLFKTFLPNYGLDVASGKHRTIVSTWEEIVDMIPREESDAVAVDTENVEVENVSNQPNEGGVDDRETDAGNVEEIPGKPKRKRS
ncbi:S49 family peptidase domain-containing protein [Cellvibrio mixtus]|uniref:hypothetical protein n=1 Tax=Cellvibrio mixtus TaxID=39650 RepID=UPI000AF5D3BF|nr:hypothetical protein [Cellvibrio mixtus]